MTTPEQDPLDQTGESTDTSMPLLKQGLCDLTIAKAEVGPTDKGTEKLSLTLKTTKDMQSKDGELLRAGFPVYHNIGLTPTDAYPLTSIARAIASLSKAAGLGNVTNRSIINDPKQLEGKIVRCKVVIKPESGGFPESNRIQQFVEVK